MSGFDENPFADPFTDPAVRGVTEPATSTTGVTGGGGYTTAPGANLDEYNPFDGQPPAATTGVGSGGPQTVPQYSAQGQQHVQTSELHQRQEELDRKAAELDRREEALRQSGAAGGVLPNNWPPLPSFVPFQPCFRQDINIDIPTTFQQLVRRLYQAWCLHSIILIANVIGAFAALIQLSEFSLFGLALLYLILFTPASYVCWFRPVYKAFGRDSSINFMVFFFVYFFQMMVSVIQALGISGMGTCGIFNGASAVKAGGSGTVFVGVLMILIGISFGVVALIDIFLLIQVHRLYRSASSASLSKAQQEFTTSVMGSDTVRNATADMAANAVRSQMNTQRY